MPFPAKTAPQAGAYTVEQALRLYGRGIPNPKRLNWQQEVLDLYGLDKPMCYGVVQRPDEVTVDGSKSDEDRPYPVLRFRRGDVYIVLGFRDAIPSILGVYAASRLDPEIGHIEERRGGGGGRKPVGLPTTPLAVIRRLKDMGVVIEIDTKTSKATCCYKGQDIGMIGLRDDRTKETLQSDYQRLTRKVAGIDRAAKLPRR